MKIFEKKINLKKFYKICKKNFGIASVFSKYVIIGGGFAGLSVSKLLTSNPFKIKEEQITLIDIVPDYTIYPMLKYHALGIKDITKYNQYLPEILPDKIRFRNNEILQLEPKENLILGNNSLRLTYDKLILACGKEPDFVETPGLLYSLQDTLNPIFSVYEYENILPKMSNYSQLLIKQFTLDYEFKVTKENDNFLKNGMGNILFVNCTEDLYEIFHNMQILILMYDLLKIHRGEEFISTLNFIITLPTSKENFIKKTHNFALYFLKLLEDRKINIKWDHKLEGVGNEQSLNFIHQNKKENISYNFSLVMPHMILPSFVRFSNIVKERKIDINKNTLQSKEFDNIFILGDALDSNDENFVDRFDTNIFNQAQIISNNIKVQHFRLEKSKIKNYSPHMNTYFDFILNFYVLVDNTKDQFTSTSLLKKTFWNNLLFKHFYYKPEGYYAQKLLLEKKLGIKII